MQFGLIREGEVTKALGAGIMSSPAAADHAANDMAKLQDFDGPTALRLVSCVIDGFEQLAVSLSAVIPALLGKVDSMEGHTNQRFQTGAPNGTLL